MRIILTKATKILGKMKPVNTVLVVSPEKAKELSDASHEYKGVFPPKRDRNGNYKKHKMSLSQLKT